MILIPVETVAMQDGHYAAATYTNGYTARAGTLWSSKSCTLDLKLSSNGWESAQYMAPTAAQI